MNKPLPSLPQHKHVLKHMKPNSRKPKLGNLGPHWVKFSTDVDLS
jgi:hypothetical protein